MSGQVMTVHTHTKQNGLSLLQNKRVSGGFYVNVATLYCFTLFLGSISSTCSTLENYEMLGFLFSLPFLCVSKFPTAVVTVERCDASTTLCAEQPSAALWFRCSSQLFCVCVCVCVCVSVCA